MGGLPSSTGHLPSAADGSRIDATPNGRIASAANTNGRAGRWGSSFPVCRVVPLPHLRALGTCVCSCPAADPGGCLGGRLRAQARGDECQGPRHLLYPPSLNFREDDRLLVGLSVHALVSVRGEGDGGLGVLCCIGLHGHPRVREGEMPETSGAS